MPKNAAVRLKDRIKELGYQSKNLAHTRLSVTLDTLDAWLSGKLPIPMSSLITLLTELNLSPHALHDDVPELADYYLKYNLAWCLLTEHISEQGLLPFIAKNEQTLERIIKNIHPTPLPLAPYFYVIKDTRCAVITKTTDNATMTISQSFHSWHLDIAKITATKNKLIYTQFITGTSRVLEHSSNTIELHIPLPCQTNLFVHADDVFSITLSDSLIRNDDQEIITVEPLNLNDLLTV